MPHPNEPTTHPQRPLVMPSVADAFTALMADLMASHPAPAWYEDASCAQADPDAFFPEKGGSTRDAKRICRLCPVRQSCLEEALETGERFGIRGGASERERRRMPGYKAPRVTWSL